MTDEKLKTELGHWATLSDRNNAMATTIITALNKRSPHVRKQVWQHDLDLDKTVVANLDRVGNKKGKPQVLDEEALRGKGEAFSKWCSPSSSTSGFSEIVQNEL